MFGSKSPIWSIPNILTFIRILAVPFVVYLLEQGLVNEQNYLWATILFALAFVTDQIDGYLSRTLNQRTTLGEILDPIADKIIVLCILIQLAYMNFIPAWIVMLLLSREIIINGLRAYASSKGLSILPSKAGKTKVYFQGFGLGFIMMSSYAALHAFPIHKIGILLIYISLVLSYVSAWDYIAQLKKHLIS